MRMAEDYYYNNNYTYEKSDGLDIVSWTCEKNVDALFVTLDVEVSSRTYVD